MVVNVGMVHGVDDVDFILRAFFCAELDFVASI